jgi:type VI secretion system protein ImpG
MSDTLYDYYERELRFLRQDAEEFSKKHPGAAGRLRLEKDRSVDPHVERLLEGAALLAGRIHHKLDDEFPEVTDALLGVLYPHYLAPIPSMTIVQFDLDPGRAKLPNGFVIDRHSRMHTQPVEYELDKRVPCNFRTCYPVKLWPVALASARLQPPPFPSNLKPPPKTAAALRLQFDSQADMNFTDLSLDKLRLYLRGDKQLVASLYEALFNQVIQVLVRSPEKDSKIAPIELEPAQCLSQVGFERDEGILPYPNQSFLGYRLLTEFFTFPNKFLFVDLGGWQRVRQAGFQKKVEVILFLKRSDTSLEQGIDKETFQLGCTPVVNLFEQTAEPIPLTHLRYEYRIKPDVGHPVGLEIYSVENVSSSDPISGVTEEYQPFYSFRHGRSRENQQMFWYATRRPSQLEDDRGTEVYLNLVDLGFNPRLPAESVIVARTLCTNRDLATKLQRAGDDLVLELEMAAPARIRCLQSPTLPLRPPLKRGAHWRLLSHLCLNHLTITPQVDRWELLSETEQEELSREGRDAFQEILRLYDFADPEAGQQLADINRQLIEGIVSIRSRRIVGRTGGPTSSGFARGLEITIEFDEEKYMTTGLYLFASVLERFLGLYASINSFTRLVAKTKQGEGYLKQWPPRAAELQLL